jgi:hypothetical protein
MSNAGIDISDDEAFPSFGGGPGGPKLPIGTYTMDVISSEMKTNKKGGVNGVVTFKVADDGEYYGVEVTKWYSLNQKPSKEGGTPAIGRFKRLLREGGAPLSAASMAELVAGAAGIRVIVEIVHTQGQDVMDAQGNVKPGGVFCDVTNEKAIQVEEAEPPPPPPAAKTAAPAQTQSAKGSAKGNGAPVARRA